MNGVSSKAAALRVLRPHRALLPWCVRKGMARYTRFAARAAGVALHPRTRAMLLNDHVVHFARQRFLGRQGVVVSTANSLFTLIFGSEIIMRFKLMSADLTTSNIPTRQQEQIAEQMVLDNMPPAATYVTLGYVLDEIGMSAARIVLTCRMGSQLIWSHDLPIASAPGLSVPLRLPIAAPPPAQIRAKRQRPQAKEETS